MFKKKIVYKEYTSDRYYWVSLTIGNWIYPRALNARLNDDRTITIDSIYIGNCKKPFNYKKFANKGYGSQMVRMLIDFAKLNKYSKINGLLLDDGIDKNDVNHKTRQLNFFKKLGFQIEEQENGDLMAILQFN